MKKKYFVTGIDTDSGKTIASAILVEALKADYWKAVQAGEPTDSDFIRNIHKKTIVHPEGLFLKYPMSPHASADLENRDISLSDLKLPQTNNNLIIEGAGGIMVPINDKELIIDVAKKFDLEIILVSRNYLGSINHTLLSIDYLKRNNYNIKGIIFNGETNLPSEQYILKHSGLKCLFRIAQIPSINTKSIKKIASTVKL